MKILSFVCYLIANIADEGWSSHNPQFVNYVTFKVDGVGEPIPYQIYKVDGQVFIQEYIGDDKELEESKLKDDIRNMPNLTPNMKWKLERLVEDRIIPAHREAVRNLKKTTPDSEATTEDSEATSEEQEISTPSTETTSEYPEATSEEQEISTPSTEITSEPDTIPTRYPTIATTDRGTIPTQYPTRTTTNTNTIPTQYPTRATTNRDGTNPSRIFKYVAHIHIQKEENPFCDGAIITDRMVVTSAGCVHSYRYAWNLHRIEVMIGPERFKVADISSYDKSDPVNDVAVLTLEKKISLKKYKSVIVPMFDTPIGTVVDIIGYKCPSSKGKITKPITAIIQKCNFDDKKQYICGERKGSDSVCDERPGSPVMHGDILVGLVITSNKRNTSKYLNICYYASWLNKQMEKDANSDGSSEEEDSKFDAVIRIKCANNKY